MRRVVGGGYSTRPQPCGLFAGPLIRQTEIPPTISHLPVVGGGNDPQVPGIRWVFCRELAARGIIQAQAARDTSRHNALGTGSWPACAGEAIGLLPELPDEDLSVPG